MRYVLFAPLIALAGCAEFPLSLPTQTEPVPIADPPAATDTLPETLAAPPPPPAARTVEQFDTTTEEQRAAASAGQSGGALLGETVASLGDPSAPGFWAETGLVEGVRAGRLVYPATGKSVEVELRPAQGGSTRVSLAAFRVLEAPLTDLPVLEVYAE